MARAFAEVFGLVDGFDGIPMNGRTDSCIISQVAERNAVACTPDALKRFRDVYVGHLQDEIPLPGPRKGVMPGVRDLLDALAARDDVYLALLTGNFEAGARVKLEYFDLWRYFACGAFGDETHDRN